MRACARVRRCDDGGRSARSSARSARRGRWTRVPELRRRAVPRPGRRRERRPPPLRSPAVLRAPLRLLRLRHRCRPTRRARPRTSTPCSRSSSWSTASLAPRLETIFLGGGTPTFTEPAALERLLAGLPDADEVTVEANPETVTPELARLLPRNRVNRVSIGAQSFHPHLLDVLERSAQAGRCPACRTRSS